MGKDGKGGGKVGDVGCGLGVVKGGGAGWRMGMGSCRQKQLAG